MSKSLVPVPKGWPVPAGLRSLITIPKGWLVSRGTRLPVPVGTRVPARYETPLPLPAPHRATLPASHDIPLGFRIEVQGERLRELWIRYGMRWQKSLITICPARGGKTICQLAYELGLYGGKKWGVAPALVVNDKKGELVAICGRARYELGDTVFKVDPFNVAEPSPYVVDATLNILEGLTPHDTAEIINLANGLLVMQGNDPHWVERPRQLAACLLAHLLDDNNEPADLPYLMTILGLPDTAFKAYMERLAESSLPFVRNLAGPFCADSKENRGIVSSMIGQLGFLNDARIARVLSGRSSFRWSDLKRGGISVFFCLPEKVAATFGRFSRLFWTSCISSLYQPPFAPILLVIDEAANSLESSMELFEHAFALGPGFGLRLHLLFQNLPQLNSLFKEQAQSVMSSAGVIQLFRPNDRTTAQYLSERAGRRTVSILNESTTINENMGDNGHVSSGISTSFSRQYFDRPQWTEQQLYEMSVHKQVLIFEGIGAPVIALRKPYWRSGWAARFDDNPYAPLRH